MELRGNLASSHSVRPSHGGLPWYITSEGGGGDKDQPSPVIRMPPWLGWVGGGRGKGFSATWQKVTEVASSG
jgi:hypothetical protein